MVFPTLFYLCDNQRWLVIRASENKFINETLDRSKPTSACLYLLLFYLPYEGLKSPNNTSKHLCIIAMC